MFGASYDASYHSGFPCLSLKSDPPSFSYLSSLSIHLGNLAEAPIAEAQVVFIHFTFVGLQVVADIDIGRAIEVATEIGQKTIIEVAVEGAFERVAEDIFIGIEVRCELAEVEIWKGRGVSNLRHGPGSG